MQPMSRVPTVPVPIRAFLNPRARHASAARASLSSDARFAPVDVAPEALRDDVRAAAEAGAPVVLVAGGDGTLRQAAQVLRGTRTALAVLPAGTRNHFARDFDIPLDPAEALDVAAAGEIRTVDLGLVDGR